MNKDPFLKVQSSKAIEELLSDTGVNHRQNWLLSYLDVFVLIVMLIITLITLGDIKIEQEEVRNKSHIKPAAVKPSRPQVNKPDSVPVVADPVSQPEPPAPPADAEPHPILPIEPIANVESAAEFLSRPVEESPSLDHQAEAETPLPMPASQEPKPAPPKRESLEDILNDKLGQLGLGQAVDIKVTEDYAQLEIQDKILFESSQASLTGPGENLLKDLAPLLKQARGLIFIEGHTDNRPIKTLQFPSNWELGSARATSVLHYLTTQGLDGRRMRAVTYADSMPIADNSTPAGREKNRRVSILIKVQEQDINS